MHNLLAWVLFERDFLLRFVFSSGPLAFQIQRKFIKIVFFSVWMFQSWISGDHVFLDRCVHMQHRIHRKLVQSMSSRILWNELSRFESLF